LRPRLLGSIGPLPKPIHLIMGRAYEDNATRQLALDFGWVPVVLPDLVDLGHDKHRILSASHAPLMEYQWNIKLHDKHLPGTKQLSQILRYSLPRAIY
jgi:hypothetical protein